MMNKEPSEKWQWLAVFVVFVVAYTFLLFFANREKEPSLLSDCVCSEQERFLRPVQSPRGMTFLVDYRCVSWATFTDYDALDQEQYLPGCMDD
jgi:hypothetical protein